MEAALQLFDGFHHPFGVKLDALGDGALHNVPVALVEIFPLALRDDSSKQKIVLLKPLIRSLGNVPGYSVEFGRCVFIGGGRRMDKVPAERTPDAQNGLARRDKTRSAGEGAGAAPM